MIDNCITDISQGYLKFHTDVYHQCSQTGHAWAGGKHSAFHPFSMRPPVFCLQWLNNLKSDILMKLLRKRGGNQQRVNQQPVPTWNKCHKWQSWTESWLNTILSSKLQHLSSKLSKIHTTGHYILSTLLILIHRRDQNLAEVGLCVHF